MTDFVTERILVDSKKYGDSTILAHYEGESFTTSQIFQNASDGVVGSRAVLAAKYFRGEHVPKDENFAIITFQKLLNENENLPFEYQFTLGSFLEAANDLILAKKEFSELSRKGFAPAKFRLAKLLISNPGQLTSEARVLLKDASLSGHLRSKIFLEQQKFVHGNFLDKFFASFNLMKYLPSVIAYAMKSDNNVENIF